MMRLTLIMMMSLAVSTQVLAATAWQNKSTPLNTKDLLLSEDFENADQVKLDDGSGNWSVEKQADGNGVYCNRVHDGWTDLNFGKENWANYAVTFKMKFETDANGTVETHIRKRNRKDYRAVLNKFGKDATLQLLNKMLFADIEKDEWVQITLSASGSTLGLSINDETPVSTENEKLKQGGGLIAVSANMKICLDDIAVVKIGDHAVIAEAGSAHSALLDKHQYTDQQKEIASQIIEDLGDRQKNLTIYEGALFQPPKSLKTQISDATLEFYFRISEARPKTRPREYYVVPGSDKAVDFKTSNKSNEKIDKQMKQGTIFSFLYFADNQIIYDALPPAGRFKSPFDETSQFQSHSMGKSITSYLIGHAICQGYIRSIDETIHDWPLMKDTLFYGQPLVNLLNMSAGDSHIVKSTEVNYKNSNNSIRNQPLIEAVKRENELLNTRPIENAGYSYSNLTSDVLFNYLAHRVGDDFDRFLAEFYQEKIGIKYPVYLSLNDLVGDKAISTKDRTLQGAWQYGISATRYDYLRIAKAILDDWQNDSCEGQYLKELHKRAVPTNYKDRSWKKWPGASYPGFGTVAQRYAGQFFTAINGLNDHKILVMMGADGQQIIVNLDEARIVVIAAGQQGWYNTKALAYDLIKTGKMKSGNWN